MGEGLAIAISKLDSPASGSSFLQSAPGLFLTSVILLLLDWSPQSLVSAGAAMLL